MKFTAVVTLAALTLFTLGQQVVAAQESPVPQTPAPSDQQAPVPGGQEIRPSAAPPTASLDGVVADVDFVCGNTRDTCQGVLDITPSADAVAMTYSGELGTATVKRNLVTIIVPPGTNVTWGSASIPITQLRVGDQVKLNYHTAGSANIANDLKVTARMGRE